MKYSLSNLQISIIIFLWLGLCVLVVWFLEYRHWSSWQDQLALFKSEQIDPLKRLLPKDKAITVMHIRDRGCICTSYQDAHVDQLQSTLKKVIHVVVEKDQRQALASPLIAPSVAIWDESGQLAYFGPYSSGAICGQGIGFVERALEQLNLGNNPDWTNTQGVGCFCRDEF